VVKPVRIAVVVLSGVFALGLGTLGALSPADAQRWVSVAANGKGRWGYAFGKATSENARAEALRGCGHGCHDEVTTRARCLAYVDSRSRGYWYGVGVGPTESAVLATARRGCGAGAPAGTCRAVKVVCG
jgi:Domain of unknown function (DUF4189)